MPRRAHAAPTHRRTDDEQNHNVSDAAIFMGAWTPPHNHHQHQHHHHNNNNRPDHAWPQNNYQEEEEEHHPSYNDVHRMEVYLFKEMRSRTTASLKAWKNLGLKEMQLTKAFLTEMESTKDTFEDMARAHRQAVQVDPDLNEDEWIKQNTSIVRDPYQIAPMQIELQSEEPIRHGIAWNIHDKDSSIYKAFQKMKGEDWAPHMVGVCLQMIQFVANVPERECVWRLFDGTKTHANAVQQDRTRKKGILNELLKEQDRLKTALEWGDDHTMQASFEGEKVTTKVFFITRLPTGPPAQGDPRSREIKDECSWLDSGIKVEVIIGQEVQGKPLQVFKLTLLDNFFLPDNLLRENSMTMCRLFLNQPPRHSQQEGNSKKHRQTVAVQCKNQLFSSISQGDVVRRIFALQLGTAKLFWQQKERQDQMPVLTLVPKSSRCWFEMDREASKIYAMVKTVATVRGSSRGHGDQEGADEEDEEEEEGKKLFTTQKLLMHTTYLLDGNFNPYQAAQYGNVVDSNNPFAQPGSNGMHLFAPFAGWQNHNNMGVVTPTMMMTGQSAMPPMAMMTTGQSPAPPMMMTMGPMHPANMMGMMMRPAMRLLYYPHHTHAPLLPAPPQEKENGKMKRIRQHMNKLLKSFPAAGAGKKAAQEQLKKLAEAYRAAQDKFHGFLGNHGFRAFAIILANNNKEKPKDETKVFEDKVHQETTEGSRAAVEDSRHDRAIRKAVDLANRIYEAGLALEKERKKGPQYLLPPPPPPPPPLVKKPVDVPDQAPLSTSKPPPKPILKKGGAGMKKRERSIKIEPNPMVRVFGTLLINNMQKEGRQDVFWKRPFLTPEESQEALLRHLQQRTTSTQILGRKLFSA